MEYQKLKSLYEKKGYPFKEDGRLNIWGCRTSYEVTNKFDDFLGFAWMEGGQEWLESWKCTTDAGWLYVDKPCNPLGTAVLAEGFHENIWEFGKHRGKYDALVQTGAAVTVWRDNNRDRKYDKVNPETGFFGINLHRAYDKYEVSDVDDWSAGCQVVPNIDEDYSRLIWLAKRDTDLGFKFKSYALFFIADMQLVVG